MKNNKIGLSICYDYHDYGSMLQSYATQRELTKMGIESEAININLLKGDIKKRKWSYFLKNIYDLSILKEKSKIIEKKLRQKVDKKLAQKLVERDLSFDNFCKTHFSISREYTDWQDLSTGCKTYDAVLVGSDQLWLPSNVMADYYTLSFVPKEIRKIAYATSFGIGNIPNKYKEAYFNFLNRIDYLSARETSGQEIIKKMTGRDVQLVCDPALLLDSNDWDEVATDGRLVQEKYIFCYFMGNNSEHRAFVTRLAKKRGYKVVGLLHLDQYISSDEKYVDYAPYNISPADFINLVKNAECICTDSFHGTIFSLIYSKSFFTFKRFTKDASLSTNTRITSLLTLLNLMNRLYSGEEKVNENFEITEYNKIQELITDFRNASKEFLKESVEKK